MANRTAPEEKGELGTPVHNSQEVQAAESRHDTKYDNDVPLSSWLRNGNATTKPAFDKGNAWRKGKGL